MLGRKELTLQGPVDRDIISKYFTGIMAYQITDSRDAA